MPDDQSNETVANLVIARSGQFGVPSNDELDPETLKKIQEHTARGIEHRERGEYDKALAEFATASRLSHGTGECRANFDDMLLILDEFFEPGGDPRVRGLKAGSLSPATIKDLAAKTNIPPGYLVTSGSMLLASYPLTPEGRSAAIKHADGLAEGTRSPLDDEAGSPFGLFILGSVVYEHDTRPREIYSVNPKISTVPGEPVQGQPSQWISVELERNPVPVPLNPNQITVHPVLFLAQDHRSGNMSLIFDPVATNRFHTPHPDREGVLVFNADPVGVTLTRVTADLDPIRPQIIVETSGDITLSFNFRSDFAEAFGPEGFAAWGRSPDAKSAVQKLETERSKPFALLGVVVQEIETPTVNHTLFFTEECRERWRSWYRPGETKVIPQFDIETSLVRFADPPTTFNIRLAVKKSSTGEVRYLRSSMRIEVGGY